MVVGHFPLQNKTCVITGGGSGINLAFVKLAVEKHNCRCLIADLKLTPEAENLCKKHPNLIAFTRCDVTKWSDLEALPSQLKVSKKEIDRRKREQHIWIAGAGIFDGSAFFYNDPKDTTSYLSLRINAEHPIKLTRIAMRSACAANRPAVILIVSSLAGICGQYASALYCASKHAVVGFTKSMMQADRDEDVKVVCILPGMVATPLWTGREARREFEQFGYSEEQCLSAEEVAEGMREMIVSEEWEGGSLMGIEKGGGGLRQRLESRQGIDVEGEGMEGWVEHAYEPIRAVLRRERGVKL
ncbi:uncharacterized protein MYCFIDRAFT_31370 [Pseudocercospora fijiensis CIRAD86]|uniref:NAD(P)-binding protein n=1 Tax=Pseudocercospora fijiensis (strain CIRAD86) TaxID=383855 RepID=M2YR40_PSEFD|nr:uncharacterized protein MYCFIDRAFT_31370 [Pseudocercospora fijiensis CIRAD86]EME80175.1 hypothetical protein MYCFIDRAFT_31370 [Pseudocercospora fijiensis CIRAD86]